METKIITGETVRDSLFFIEKLKGKEIVELENAIIERCAVELWNLWSEQPDATQYTERSKALSEAVKRIRKLKTSL